MSLCVPLCPLWLTLDHPACDYLTSECHCPSGNHPRRRLYGNSSLREESSANPVSHAIITAAMQVHTELGPGLLESTYLACLQYELEETGCRCLAQVGLPVVYRGVRLDLGYRMDLLVEDLVIVEIKSVDAISPVHQRPSYFRTLSSVANPSGCL